MAKKITVATINAGLKKAGIAERIYQAKNYVYFVEGNALSWFTSTVGGVRRVTDMQEPVEWWIRQRNILAEAKF